MAFVEFEKRVRSGSIKNTGLIHVGAHWGQELALYNRLGFSRVYFIEADPTVYKELCRRVVGYKNVTPLLYTVSDIADQEVDFYITTNQGKSSSILDLNLHATEFPTVKVAQITKFRSTTLDLIVERENIDVSSVSTLVIDVQGAELRVLQGALMALSSITAVLTEINMTELYKHCALLPDIDVFMQSNRFTRVAIGMVTKTYGDALYVRS